MMTKRKWIFGSLYLAIGILVGHIITRAGSATAPSTAYAGAGIPLANALPNLPATDGPSLKLTDVTFCHKISSFGNYLTYDRDEFWPGQEVLIYAEIGNLHSDLIPDGKFRTAIKSTIEFLRDGGPPESVDRFDIPMTIDLCRRPRHDYFQSYQITIPSNLTAGRYLLRLTVQDQLDHREACRSMIFSVK